MLEGKDIQENEIEEELLKTKNLNLKVSQQDYEDMKKIAKGLGVNVSVLVRMVLNERLERVKRSGQNSDFLT